MEGGLRVRPRARMPERAHEEAEAKFGAELSELHKSEKGRKEGRGQTNNAREGGKKGRERPHTRAQETAGGDARGSRD